MKTEEKTAERFSVKKSGGSTWNVYDSQRGVTILKTVSPNAVYNESTVREVVNLLNAQSRTEQLQAFKDYVHKRLDAMGIPVDPESPHKANGCRIGGRLDIVEQLQKENAELKQENERLRSQINSAVDDRNKAEEDYEKLRNRYED